VNRFDSETPQEAGFVKFVHSDIPPDVGPAWILVTGPAAANFDHWVEPDDPPPAAPDGFDSFA
jgi:hypothetical protein